jgi:hypothetical protein
MTCLRVLCLALAFVVAAPAPKMMKDLVFLTRDGCVQTPEMRKHLDEALTALHWPKTIRAPGIRPLPCSGKLRTFSEWLPRNHHIRSRRDDSIGRSSVP